MSEAETTAAVLDAPAPAELLSTTEAAKWVGVSRFTIKGWIAGGYLPTVVVGHRHRIRPADLVIVQANAHVGKVVPAWRRNRQRAGQRLRALREAAGLNQIQLAETSGLTHEAISRLETGREAPYADTVRQLAQALGVEPERFVGRGQMGLSMLTVAEAATRLGVPAGRVQRWMREGMLAGEKVSGRWRVPAVVVAELARSGRLRGRSARLDPRYRG